jgi:hypothetical protein
MSGVLSLDMPTQKLSVDYLIYQRSVNGANGSIGFVCWSLRPSRAPDLFEDD